MFSNNMAREMATRGVSLLCAFVVLGLGSTSCAKASGPVRAHIDDLRFTASGGGADRSVAASFDGWIPVSSDLFDRSEVVLRISACEAPERGGMPLYVAHPVARNEGSASEINSRISAGPGNYWLISGDGPAVRSNIQSGERICAHLEGILADGRDVISNSISTVAP